MCIGVRDPSRCVPLSAVFRARVCVCTPRWIWRMLGCYRQQRAPWSFWRTKATEPPPLLFFLSLKYSKLFRKSLHRKIVPSASLFVSREFSNSFPRKFQNSLHLRDRLFSKKKDSDSKIIELSHYCSLLHDTIVEEERFLIFPFFPRILFIPMLNYTPWVTEEKIGTCEGRIKII